jgi:hypothetical protein
LQPVRRGAVPSEIGSAKDFLTTIGSGTVNFNNTMRVGGLITAIMGNFFKITKATIVEKK